MNPGEIFISPWMARALENLTGVLACAGVAAEAAMVSGQDGYTVTPNQAKEPEAFYPTSAQPAPKIEG